MVDLGEMLREEASYQASFIGTTKILHHDCITSEQVPQRCSTVTSLLPTHYYVACSHNIMIAGTKVRILVYHTLHFWLFQWISDGKHIPEFVIKDGECIQKNSLEGEQRLSKLGLREGVSLRRFLAKKLKALDWSEYVHPDGKIYKSEVPELEELFRRLCMSEDR